MSELAGCAGDCPRIDTYCDRCNLLVGLFGLRVLKVHAERSRLVVTMESPRVEQGCCSCGVIAASHVRRTVWLVDAPCFGRRARMVWRKRTWRARSRPAPSASSPSSAPWISTSGTTSTNAAAGRRR